MTSLNTIQVNKVERVTLRMDSTQIVQFMKCPTLHNFVSVQNLTRKREDRSALDRGTLFHGLLERYYRKIWEKDSNPTAFALSQLTELKKTVDLTPDDYKLLALRFMEYTFKYSKDQIKILTGSDGKPAIEIGFSIPILDNDNYLFVLEGRIDLITEASGQLIIWDHKYQGREYSYYGKSIQALNYRLASGARIFMYNYIRGHQKVQANTFDRQSDSISKTQLEAWKQKLIRIFLDYTAINEFNKNNYTKVMPDFPNQSCQDIGFGKKCPFTHICEETHPGVKKALLERDFMQKKEWEPWNLEEVTE